jgi:two-component system, NtrC family, sensor histidine kinase GlrK
MSAMKVALDFPQRYYPRSFLKLLLFAFGAVVLPLIVAFVNAAVYVDRLADQSQSAVAQAAQAGRASRQLMEQVTGLERVVRQYLVLGDGGLIDDYRQLRGGFKSTTSELSLLPLDEVQLQELNRTIDKEQELYDLLVRTPLRPRESAALIQGYVALSELARGVLDVSNKLIDRELERMRETGAHAQRILWWQLIATIPVGVLIAIGVTFLIARPIQQLDQAIRRLGAGQFAGDIRVKGPEDLEYLGKRLDWLRQRLAELEQQQRLFLRHVSHELKTPLTALREGSELLADGATGKLTAQQLEIAGILRQKSVQLQGMIEELLDYQRAQENVARLEFAPVRLDAVAKRVVDDHRLAADARGIRTRLHLEPVMLRGDREKLRVVVDNLVSNAVKYSPDGGTISLTLRREHESVVLDVSDTGPGIPTEDHGRIFDWFFRGEHGHHGRVQGSGLGLAIAKEFVAAHSGRIEVVSDGAAGGHFRVSLPAT